ncbi:hypothetical protein ACRAWF_18555 [Streptomyces sp. L7]
MDGRLGSAFSASPRHGRRGPRRAGGERQRHASARCSARAVRHSPGWSRPIWWT